LREVVVMAWPIVLGALSFVIMDFVDKVFVGWLGRVDMNPAYLAAVGSAGIWSYTLGVFFIGVAGCVSTFVSQSLGRGKLDNCSRYAWQGIYIAFGAGAFALLLLPVSRPLFASMNHSAEVTELELVYFRVRLAGYAFIAWQTALSSFFQAVGRPIIPMYATIVGNVLNIGLDYVFIFGKFGMPAMGIGGAAWATVLSMLVQAAMLHMLFMNDRVNGQYASRQTWRIESGKLRELFNIGWPAGLSSLFDVAAWSIFISFIVGSFGASQLAANTAAINFMHLTFVPAMAIGMAVTPIVGRWLGRGDYLTARRRAFTAMKLGMVIMITVGTMLAVFGGYLMRAFTIDPEVIELGHFLLILAAIFAGFDAMSIILMGALRGAGDTRWIMAALFVGSYLVCLPLAALFAVVLDLGAKGAWYGATIYIIGLSGVFFWRFHQGQWRHINIFTAETAPLQGTVASTPPTPIAAEVEVK
jgi:MATE family multidrug resistance protein